MALLKRQETGRGDYVEIAMLDSLFAATPNIMGPVLAENRAPDPKAQRTTGGAAFYRLYDTRDGRQIALAGQEPKFIERALTALGLPDLSSSACRGRAGISVPRPKHACCSKAVAAGVARLVGVARRLLCAGEHAARSDRRQPSRGARAAARRRAGPQARRSRDSLRGGAGTAELREPTLGEHQNELLAELNDPD